MPAPQDMKTNPLLQQFVLSYALNRQGLIADKIAPKITGVPDNGTFYKWFKRSAFKDVDLSRPIGKSYKQVDYDVSKDTYETEDKGLRAPIDEKERRRAEADGTILSLRNSKARLVMDNILVTKEKEVADALRSTATLTQNTTLTSTDRWNDYDNSDPVANIRTGIQTIRAATGLPPSRFKLFLPFDVMMTLAHHPVLLAYNGRTDVRDLGEADLAKIFRIGEVVVADAIYDSGAETLSDEMTGADIWGKDAILAYVEPDPDREARSLAYQFVAKDFEPNDYVSVDSKTEWVEVGFDQVLKVIDPSCGYLLKTVID